jgi:hypothetical protein
MTHAVEISCHHLPHHPTLILPLSEFGGPSVLKVVKASLDDVVQVWGFSDLLTNVEHCAFCLFVPRGKDVNSVTIVPAKQHDISIVLRQHEACTVHYINTCDHNVDLFWIDENEKEVRITSTKAKGRDKQNTFLGHVFVIRNSATKEIVDWFQVDGSGERTLVCTDHTLSKEEVCVEGMTSCGGDTQLNSEKGLEMFLWEKDWHNRLALNRIQPRLVQNLTDFGFEKRRIPDGLLEQLQLFLRNNAHQEIMESSAGPVMNQDKVHTYMTHLGTAERRGVENAVKVHQCLFSSCPQ